MTRLDFFVTILLSLIATAFFTIFYYVLSPPVSIVAVAAFIITFVLFIFFEEQLRTIVLKIARKQYYLTINKAQQLIETLNANLNSARRFHEVTQQIFESFDQMFKSLPYAFYVFEDSKYLLYHSANLEDNDLLSLDIKAAYLSKTALDKLFLPNFEGITLPAEIIQKLKSAGLTCILPFRGHNQIFAFLAIDHKKISFYHAPHVWKQFQRIQKKAGLILENTALFIDLEKKNFEIRKLIEVSQKILASLDTKDILDFILSSLKHLIDFDAAAIFLLDESGKRLLNTSSKGYDSSLIDKLHLKVGQGACGWVVQTKKVDVLDDINNAEHYMSLRPETRSQISIPILFEENVLGVICLESNRIAFFNQNLSELLQLFAHLAAIAIYNARQLNIRLAKQALELELINASAVQQRLLVQQFPRIREMSLHAVIIPSKIVSGDLYDVIRYSESTIGIAIGDVSGKGAPAALMMTLILANLRSQKRTFYTACDLIYRLNNMLHDSTIEGKYATFFYGIFDQDEHKIIYTNAGHNAPIFVKANGEVRRLFEGGIVLGFIPNTEYIQREIAFEQGDVLVAFTDGISEAMNSEEEEYGEERLIRIVQNNRHLSVHALKDKILGAVREFSGLDTPEDDMTLLICRHE